MTTFADAVKSGGRRKCVEGGAVLAARFSFDPTAASAALQNQDSGQDLKLPAGARVIGVTGFGGGTGGTSPTVDIGTESDGDAFAAELAADAAATAVTGASIGALLTADTTIYGGVGASAATGGTITGVILYIRS